LSKTCAKRLSWYNYVKLKLKLAFMGRRKAEPIVAYCNLGAILTCLNGGILREEQIVAQVNMPVAITDALFQIILLDLTPQRGSVYAKDCSSLCTYPACDL